MRIKNITLTAVLLLFALPVLGHESPRRGNVKHLNGILSAIAAEDYPAFLYHGNDALAKNVEKVRFEELVEELKQVLLEGYTLTSSGNSTKGKKHIILTWMLQYGYDSKTEIPNIIIRMDTEGHGGKVINFLIE